MSVSLRVPHIAGWLSASAASVLVLTAPAEAAPLQPTSPWNVHYTATSCEAKRRFGDYAISFAPAPLGETIRMMIEMPGPAARARQFPAVIDTGGNSEPEKASALLFPLSKKGLRGIYSVMPKATAYRAFANGELGIRVGSAINRDATSVKAAHAHLALGKTEALRKALDTCLTDLQQHWGMVDGKLPVATVQSQPTGKLYGIFQHSDYPEDAILANQDGKTQFLLMIGTSGEVLDCVVHKSSGVASLDAMGCQVLRERAKFIPAKDAAGKPIVGAILTPEIHWKMG